MLFDYPPAALVDRVIAKDKFYKQAGLNAKMQRLFAEQVKQIRWLDKLAPQSLNIPAAENVKEVQIFGLALNGPEVNEAILAAIDKAVPSPIFYEAQFGGQVRMLACLKRQPAAGGAAQLSAYCATAWQSCETPRQSLPFALNMEQLYEKMLKALIAENLPPDLAPMAQSTGPAELLARAAQIAAQQTEIERLKSRLKGEKQFNRKLALNAELAQAIEALNILAGQ